MLSIQSEGVPVIKPRPGTQYSSMEAAAVVRDSAGRLTRGRGARRTSSASHRSASESTSGGQDDEARNQSASTPQRRPPSQQQAPSSSYSNARPTLITPRPKSRPGTSRSPLRSARSLGTGTGTGVPTPNQRGTIAAGAAGSTTPGHASPRRHEHFMHFLATGVSRCDIVQPC
jgi:hypothetical protein